jgi:hypothetical protein
MREHIAISTVLIVASTPLAAQTPGCGPVPVVVTVGQRTISIDSTPPWVFNCGAGLPDGAAVVLTRPAETRSTGWGWIYVSEWASTDSARSFDDRVSGDIAERRRAVGGDLNVTSAGRLKTRDGTVVVLRHLATRGVSGRSVYEVVAYAQDAPIIFGVKAFTDAALTATLPQFDRFIQSVTIRPEGWPFRPAPPDER